MQPLVERWKPKTIDAFAGLSRVKPILAAFAADPYPSAWLYLGSSGTGKTTMALALAEQIGAEVMHIPSRRCDLETVQNTLYKCHLTPMFGNKGWHLVLTDESDQMSRPAQHAFLSALDTTAFPPSTVFIFTANSTAASNGAPGLEDRFLSRVKVLKFGTDDLCDPATKLLQRVWRKEVAERHKADRRRKIPEPPDFAAILLEARLNVREALNILEMELLAPGSFQPTLTAPAAPPAARGGKSMGRIYTIGYVGLTAPALTETLDTLGVTLLIDVRINPKTKTTGFSRPELEQAYGRRYQWAGDRLGEDAMTTEGLEWLESLARAGQTTMLLAREEAPGACHRHTMIARQLLERGIHVAHLYADQEIDAMEFQRSIDDGDSYEYTSWRELRVA